MAPRQTARRLLVAAPALALTALAVTACSPPNEEPADPDAPYTLPTYTEEPKASEKHTTTTNESARDEAAVEGGEVLPNGETDVLVDIPVEGQAPAVGQQAPAAGQQAPAAGQPAPAQPAP